MRFALALVLLASCGGETLAVLDSGPERADSALPVDAQVRDGSPPLSWVDFVASGCPSYDPTGPTCSGTAPLALRFVAVSPAPIDTFIWSFGDGSPDSTERSPRHQFAVPGSYKVQLTVGGSGGSTAQSSKMDFVVVAPVALGAACLVNAQCQPGLDCVCGAGQPCPTSLAQGFCTRACDGGNPCGDGAVCADLGPAGNPQLTPWQTRLCIPACVKDDDCGAGFRCRELADGRGSGWTHGCFPPDLLGDDGAPCFAPNGTPDPTRCASGNCAALGARGTCAAACPDHACPSYAACAQFNTTQSMCLARCNLTHPCTGDPWLDCEAPVASGTYGFSVAETPQQYCAPRRCERADQCGVDGACILQGGAGFCAAGQ